MKYSDSPRKIYGKVTIIYSDTDISRDIAAKVSGNSQISHPNEVYLGYFMPSVKACTMDGNSTMDGTFQMIDESAVCGWWSGALCDGNGVFAKKPFIELAFVKRPIISWRVLGDTKLKQYPVDYVIEYKRDGETVERETVVGNAELENEFKPQVDDITSVRLTISKWSTPNACAKILVCYDRLAEEYQGDAMQMFEVNEELGAADGNYNINSDTMTVSLYNKERKFDKGYLRSLLILDRKVLPSIGIEDENGQVEYEPLGTFYSDEWQVSQDSQWVKVSAVDKLLRMQSKTYQGYPLTPNASLYEMAVDILQSAGLSEKEYQVSESLKDIRIEMAYLPKTSVWDALQEIANAGLCRVYQDREDRTIVRAEEEPTGESNVTIEPGNMFSYTSNISLTEFANCIIVEYCEISVLDELVDAAEVSVALNPNETKTIEIDYTTDIAYASAASNNANIRVVSLLGGVDYGLVTIENKTSKIASAVITVSGNAIEINTKKHTKRDEKSISNFGVVEYTHPTSELVQTQERAEYIAKILLNRMKAGGGVITQEWRGNPTLELGSCYKSVDRFGEENELVCEYNKFTYDGGLRQGTRGRKK